MFLVLGLACVGLGYVGVMVPGMPSVVFFLIALWSFKRSSPRFENWLLNHRLFGATLRDWEETKSITMRTKVVAVVAITVSIAVSLFFVSSMLGKAILIACGLGVCAWLLTRKTKAV